MSRALRMAGQALSIANGLKVLINSEHHFIDKVNGPSNMTNAGTIVNLTGVAQGDTDTSRTGDSVLAQGFLIKGYMSRTAEDSLVRVILFKASDYDGALPTVTQILETAHVNSPYKKSGSFKFRILEDRTYFLNNTDKSRQHFKMHVNMNKYPWHVEYIGTTAVDASAGNNQLCILFLSYLGANYPTIDFYSRFSFTDN